MNKGIIYVRVSSADQTQGTSLDSQERACIEYAERKNISIDRIFIEKGESATAATRTEFLKALEYCRLHSGEIKTFIVWKIDRFARNTTDHFAVRAKLTKHGVTLQSVTEPITQDHMGKLMETFLAGYAEFENEVRKQRCTGGMQARLSEGIWCWSPPIGYVNSKRIKDRRKITPDVPDEARFYLIQKGLHLYKVGNHTITALAKESIGWGLVTRTGKPFSKQLWEKILVDKFYAGIITDPWSGKEYPGQHKPMITRSEYEQIQQIKRKMSNKATAARPAANPYFPLRRFVGCTCGRYFTASWSKGRNKRYPIYHCHNRECDYFGQSIAKEVIETKFCQFLQGISPSPAFLALFKQTVIGCFKEQQNTRHLEKTHRQRELAKFEKRRMALIEMRVAQEISKEEFTALKEILDSQVRAIDQLGNTEKGSDDIETAVSYAVEIISDAAKAWLTMNLALKQRFQKAVLPQGIIYDKATGTFGTAIVSPILRLNGAFLTGVSDLVAEVGRNWNQITQDIQNIALIAEDFDSTKEHALAIEKETPSVPHDSVGIVTSSSTPSTTSQLSPDHQVRCRERFQRGHRLNHGSRESPRRNTSRDPG